MEEKCGQCHYFDSKDGICRNKQMQKECFQGDKDNIYVSREEQKCALFKAKKRKTMTDNEKKANEIAVSIMSKGHIDKNGMCQRRDLERAAMEMAKYKDDAIDVLNGQNEALEAQLKKARAANVEFFDNVKRLEAELKTELDALKAEHAKAQQQLTEYRQTLAELSKSNSEMVKEITALSLKKK